MPVYGDAPWLEESLESIAQQIFKDFELILILDRPNDSTEKKIEKFLSRVVVRNQIIYSKTPGISAALNLGILNAKGELLARLDSDDTMRPDRLKIQAQEFYVDEDLQLLGSQIEFLNENSKVLGKSQYPCGDVDLRQSLSFRNPFAHPSVMFRKSTIKKLGGYNPKFNGAEDYDLWHRLALQGTIRNHPETLTSYRRSEHQTTFKNKTKQLNLDTLVRIQRVLGGNEKIQSLNENVGRVSLGDLSWQELELLRANSLEDVKQSFPKEFSRIQAAHFLNKAMYERKNQKALSPLLPIAYLCWAAGYSPQLTKFAVCQLLASKVENNKVHSSESKR